MRIQPKKGIRAPVLPPVPTRPLGTSVGIVSFDGSAKPKRGRGACGAVVWDPDTWKVVKAASITLEEATVNEAEYKGAALALTLAAELGIRHVILVGDSNLVVRQLRAEMECRAAGLKCLKNAVEKLTQSFASVQYFHVKRDFNQAADLLAGRALVSEHQNSAPDAEIYQELEDLNKLPEVFEEIWPKAIVESEPKRV